MTLDPYWQKVADDAEKKRASRIRYQWNRRVAAQKHMQASHNPVGKKCTWCHRVIQSGGMINPQTSNSAFCNPTCYGKHMTWKGK